MFPDGESHYAGDLDFRMAICSVFLHMKQIQGFKSVFCNRLIDMGRFALCNTLESALFLYDYNFPATQRITQV